jgi:PEP-CTERM motif
LGQVVGTAFHSNGAAFNFIETHGKLTVISDAISPLSGNAINDKDEVLGSLGFPNYGILNPHGVISPIDTSGANGTAFVEGFNNLDQITGEVCDSVTCHGFIDRDGVFTKIDPPTPHSRSVRELTIWVRWSVAISIARAMVTLISIPRAISLLFKTRTLPQQWAERGPDAVNDLDQIVGSYIDAAGNFHAFLATPNLSPFALATTASLADPVPEPSTWAMMLIGLAGLGFLCLRTRATKLASSVASQHRRGHCPLRAGARESTLV